MINHFSNKMIIKQHKNINSYITIAEKKSKSLTSK